MLRPLAHVGKAGLMTDCLGDNWPAIGVAQADDPEQSEVNRGRLSDLNL